MVFDVDEHSVGVGPGASRPNQKGLAMHVLSTTATALVCAALLGCAGRDSRASTGSAGRIALIGTTRPPDLSPGATEIDGAGRFLVPGLIDGHVHLGDVPGVNPEQLGAMQGTIEAYFR